MVTLDSNRLDVGGKRPLFIYITGCDGTGKSTQSEMLMQQLDDQGMAPRHLWLRFPFFLSLPLLAYARLRGFSWSEDHGSVQHGYWDFQGSWLLRLLFPWVLLIDATWAALRKVYIPLWQRETIVCERFVLDMLVDMSLAFGKDMHRTFVGKLFLRLLPAQTHIIILDLDGATVRARRADLWLDKRLSERLTAFRRLSADLNLTECSSQMAIQDLNHVIQRCVGLPQN
ncbi:MAG: thymidylate kinase-like protein [Chloroflexi bacterium]|nr:thymidylate kinase-like protein [Chloroflexota bacterium]